MVVIGKYVFGRKSRKVNGKLYPPETELDLVFIKSRLESGNLNQEAASNIRSTG
ncbi:MAG: hypothetical protein ACI8PB_001197 [Desulforhopalus sp.]